VAGLLVAYPPDVLHKPLPCLRAVPHKSFPGNRPSSLLLFPSLNPKTTGLLLFTNDGDLAHKLTHPRYGHEKTYDVTVSGKISGDALAQWRRGVWLDGRKTAPAKVKVIRRAKTFTRLEIVMREGRKRQIRRVANLLGYPVTQLTRVKNRADSAWRPQAW